ncbi:methyl-accepting chemotaxis protein [Simplicispira lacusdiani]|uniref:methyl-accepting chemotaxis protein n=1 Tax=Simplicispira lacusdiani TaxID=2213010 RepID=UPI000E749ED9|nr:PAS domain-containing methyl-accepting chemotaxis protein [Simplicispira lacusdiani]
MRLNQPVTQNEYAFPPEETLVSVTDLKGRITYCNPAFIHVSGFSRDELLGQPHNIVRHPDMPAEAFRDLWESIQSGQPWTGIVKNRRKNGDYYWVQANATPMLDGDRITGFLSVRTLPSREQVREANSLYARMRQEAAEGRCVHALRSGTVVRTDLAGKALRLLRPSTPAKLLITQAATLSAAATPILLGATWPVSALVAAACIASSTWLIRQWTIAPLHRLVKDANRLASGDLSLSVETGATGVVGYLQQALNQVSVNLRTVVQDVRQEVRNLDASVREIASGNQDMSSRTEAQTSNLQQTAASMEEIHGTMQHSAASATRGAQIAHDTSDVARRSDESVHAVTQTMHQIAESSQRIQDIIQLIEGVAFQTNILALNAAVEAARAGDQGRGFAVVASEVRSLAHRAAEAAKDIKQLIAESSSRVTAGVATAEQAREIMHTAVESVSRVRTVLDEISSAAGEQKTGISQINEAIAHLDLIAQQNAAMVEELAAATQAVYGQVQGVNQSMMLFRLSRGDTSLSQLDAVALRREGKQVALLNA